MPTTHPQQKELGKGHDQSWPTILVVEDQPLLSVALCMYLEDARFKTLEARNAAEAIEIVLTEDSVDLVFTDVRLGSGMDGFRLAQWVRNTRPSVPVIVTSGLSSKDDAIKHRCTQETFVQKPYDFENLAAQFRATIAAAW
jgi:DNA-binding response OmpR family regulator